MYTPVFMVEAVLDGYTVPGLDLPPALRAEVAAHAKDRAAAIRRDKAVAAKAGSTTGPSPQLRARCCGLVPLCLLGLPRSAPVPHSHAHMHAHIHTNTCTYTCTVTCTAHPLPTWGFASSLSYDDIYESIMGSRLNPEDVLAAAPTLEDIADMMSPAAFPTLLTRASSDEGPEGGDASSAGAIPVPAPAAPVSWSHVCSVGLQWVGMMRH